MSEIISAWLIICPTTECFWWKLRKTGNFNFIFSQLSSTLRTISKTVTVLSYVRVFENDGYALQTFVPYQTLLVKQFSGYKNLGLYFFLQDKKVTINLCQIERPLKTVRLTIALLHDCNIYLWSHNNGVAIHLSPVQFNWHHSSILSTFRLPETLL